MVSVLARLVRMSLPSRGAWIEIPIDGFQNTVYRSLPSRGAWIEISLQRKGMGIVSRSPHGERGLKSPQGPAVHQLPYVAPLTGSVD